MSPRPSPRTQGFTLLEVLVAVAIVSIAVFPLLLISAQAEVAAFDAKFTEISCSQIRAMLSQILQNAQPGDTAEGDFSELPDDEGFDERFAYENIRYEWEVEAIDLSEDLIPGEDEEEDGSSPSDGAEVDEEQIDDRFRARYVKITVWYALESGEEQEFVVESILPPLPRETPLGVSADLVPPNNGP